MISTKSSETARKTSILKLNEYCKISLKSMKNYSDEGFFGTIKSKWNFLTIQIKYMWTMLIRTF